MDDKSVECILKKLSNPKLIEVSRNVNLKINGFRDINVKKGVLIPPQNLIVRELLKKKYRKKVEKILNPDKYQNLLKCKEKETDNITEISNCKIEKDKLIKEIDTIRKKNIRLEEYNEKTKINLKNFRKENLLLKEENIKVKKESEKLSKENKRYKEEFYNIKDKYDKLKNVEKNQLNQLKNQLNELDKENVIIKKLEDINKNLNFKIDMLEREKKEKRKKIIVFGEIKSKKIIDTEKYDIYTIDENELSDLNVDINEFDEAWILSYKISYLDKKNIENKIDKMKKRDFPSYKKLKEYVKKEKC
ncbi:hypothetical protein ACFIJ5_14320 [Haloimpatiens sp. FM7330]|uniref:hypothetical protein n=1 Tax=Haloimpatiens sp. FM7330 TaxID=3298610 RepID=UPI00363342DB